MRVVEIFKERFMRVIEVRTTKKWITLFHVAKLQTMKVRPTEYKEIFIRPVRGDWRFLKKILRSRRDLYDRKGRRYAKDLVERILEHKTTRIKDGEVSGGN